MKNLIIIGGPAGVGKTSACMELRKIIPSNVMLDADWCWFMNPFKVTDETKKMVEDNITYSINNFLACTEIENVIFCWTLAHAETFERIVSRINVDGVKVHNITLLCSADELRNRTFADTNSDGRDLDKWIGLLPEYQMLPSIKINTDNLTPKDVSTQISSVVRCA